MIVDAVLVALALGWLCIGIDRLARGVVAMAHVAMPRDESLAGEDLVGAVVVEFEHRTTGPWLERDRSWLVDDTAWLELGLEHVLGMAKRATEVPSQGCQRVGDEVVVVVGCPGCSVCEPSGFFTSDRRALCPGESETSPGEPETYHHEDGLPTKPEWRHNGFGTVRGWR